LNYKITFIALALLLLSIITGCARKEKESHPVVAVSIQPHKYLVEQIAGDIFSVAVLLPPGANHETFEPTPRDITTLNDAKLFFSIGALDFEKNWLPRFLSSHKEMEVVELKTGLDLILGHEHGHGHEHPHEDQLSGKEDETGVDPHIWLSVSAMKIQAATVADALSKTDPEHTDIYRANLDHFLILADSVDMEIRKILEGMEGKSFMIFHPALGYFARDYGLNQVSIEEEGKEPSAGRLKELIDEARAASIKVILVSEEFDTRHAQAVAREIGASVVTFNPMSYEWPAMMIELARIIAHH